MIPLLAVVVSAIIFSRISYMNQTYQSWSTILVALAQFVGVIVLVALHFNRCKKVGFVRILSQGCTGMWGFLLLALLRVRLRSGGHLLRRCHPIQNWVLGLNLNPYISAMLSVAVIAAPVHRRYLRHDGVAAHVRPDLSDMGVNAGALRRLLLCTTQTFDSPPHAQFIANTLGVFGLIPSRLTRSCLSPPLSSPRSSIFCCICCMISTRCGQKSSQFLF